MEIDYLENIYLDLSLVKKDFQIDL